MTTPPGEAIKIFRPPSISVIRKNRAGNVGEYPSRIGVSHAEDKSKLVATMASHYYLRFGSFHLGSDTSPTATDARWVSTVLMASWVRLRSSSP